MRSRRSSSSLNGRRIGPIGMSEEKDEATRSRGRGHGARSGRRRRRRDRGCAAATAGDPGYAGAQAVGRRQARVREILHTLPAKAQEAILDDLEGTLVQVASRFSRTRFSRTGPGMSRGPGLTLRVMS